MPMMVAAASADGPAQAALDGDVLVDEDREIGFAVECLPHGARGFVCRVLLLGDVRVRDDLDHKVVGRGDGQRVREVDGRHDRVDPMVASLVPSARERPRYRLIFAGAVTRMNCAPGMISAPRADFPTG